MARLRISLPRHRAPRAAPRRLADPRVSKNLSDISRDRLRIEKLIEQNEARRRAGLEEQRGVQRTRLEDLTGLLAGEEQRKFGQAIPEIAESAQAQGFLETSGFGEALARERTGLAGQTAFQLGRQALSDRDLEVSELGAIAREETATRTGGVQREFSQADLVREEQLARELAIIGRPTESRAQKPTTLDRFGQIAGIIGAVAPAVTPFIPTKTTGPFGTTTTSKATHLCTHLKNLGLMTEKEVKAVHKRVFPAIHDHLVDWLMYQFLAPLFIKFNKDYDWQSLKSQLCEEILTCKTNEEAFQMYKSAVMELFAISIEGEKVYG